MKLRKGKPAEVIDTGEIVIVAVLWPSGRVTALTKKDEYKTFDAEELRALTPKEMEELK